MPAPFADIVDRINRDAIGLLADAVATWQGRSANVVFDRRYINAIGVASSNPVIHALDDAFEGVIVGDLIHVAGEDFTVASIEPDGAGVLLLHLERAP